MNKYDKILLLFFSSRGRLGRLAYTCLFIFTIIFFTLINNIFSFEKYITYFQTGIANIISSVIKEIVVYITNILAVIIFIFLSIKRLHDINKSGFTMLYFSFVVLACALVKCYITAGYGFECVLNIIIKVYFISIILLCILPGNKNDNKYGRKTVSLFDLGLKKLD